MQAARTTSERGIHPLALLTDRVATRRGAAICLALSLLVAVAANLAASSLPAPKKTIDSLPSSAGTILAGAFAVLAVLPLRETVEPWRGGGARGAAGARGDTADRPERLVADAAQDGVDQRRDTHGWREA